MFGSLDKTWCTNRRCPKSDRCGRSVKRLDGYQVIVSMAGFRPKEDGSCDYEEEYSEPDIDD